VFESGVKCVRVWRSVLESGRVFEKCSGVFRVF
jgi:hypothetical protein